MTDDLQNLHNRLDLSVQSPKVMEKYNLSFQPWI